MSRLNFRCWDSKEKHWLDESEVYKQLAKQTVRDSKHSRFIFQQSTGVRICSTKTGKWGCPIRSGKEIYEGDIVSQTTTIEKLPAEIIWNNVDASFEVWEKKIKYLDSRISLDIYDYSLKIIGNIYDNPELLQ